MVYKGTFRISAAGFADIKDVTAQVAGVVSDSRLSEGVATVFVAGSTAGLTTIEYEPGAVLDLKAAIERMAPEDVHYNHDARWGDGNGFSHVRAALIGPSLAVPFQNSELSLGTWQQIVFCDFDNKSRSRNVIVQVIGV